MAPGKHSFDMLKHNFYDFLVIYRVYFSGERKVSCLLATRFKWFPYIKPYIKRLKQKLWLFLLNRQNRESPAGDQFWQCDRQCSIFGHIGDQWVKILSPVLAEWKLNW